MIEGPEAMSASGLLACAAPGQTPVQVQLGID
jgi:hypothetical protein